MKRIIIYSTIGLLAVNAFAASKLTFDTSAKPTSLVLGGVEFLNSKSSGFNLRYSNGKDVTDTRLSKISTSGNKIRVSHPDGELSFTFQIEPYDNHLAIHLLDMQGIGTGRNYSLSLDLDSGDVAAYTLNDLMTADAGNQRRIGSNTVLSWPYLSASQRDTRQCGPLQ